MSRGAKIGGGCFGVFILGVVLVVCLAIAGWVQNIYALTQCDGQAPYKAEMCRVVGILPPIGAVMGWIDIDDTPKDNE